MFLFILFSQFLGCFSIDPRAVQVDVETSFIFRPKDVQKHNSVINNIKSLLRSLEKHFNVPKPNYRNQNLDGELTAFFTNLGEKFVEQNDDYIRNFTNTLGQIMENYYFRNEFTPIFGDDVALQAYVVNNSLNKWPFLSVQNIRANIKEALKTDDTIFHKIIQLADRFFNETDRKPLDDIATDLSGGNEKRKDLDKVIKGAVNFIIIKKFKSLNNYTRQLLQNEIKKLLYGYNKLDDVQERKLDSVMNINVARKNMPEISTTEKKYLNESKKEINLNTKETNKGNKEINEALREINEDLERIKKLHIEKKPVYKSEEKIKKEGEVLLKQVEKEIRRTIPIDK